MTTLKRSLSLLMTMLVLLALMPAVLLAKPGKPAAQPSLKEVKAAAQVLELKHWSNPDYTRIAITLDRDVTWETHELDKGASRSGKPGRIFIDLKNTKLSNTLRDITIGDGLLKGVRTGLYKPGVVRVVLDTDNIRDYKIFPLSDPARLIIDVRGDRRTEISRLENSISSRIPDSPTTSEKPATEEPKAARTSKPVRQQPAIAKIRRIVVDPDQTAATPDKGIKPARKPPVLSKIRRIVVDPGHGGHDPGAVGQSGLTEKEVALSIGLKLREKLKEELGLDVVMTRSTDVFIPLEERTAIANKVNADLFVSVHANAAANRNANGIETYYLNLAKTEKVAQLAAKENGTTLEKVSVLQAILFDLMANYKLNDSAHLAEEVQKFLFKTTKAKHPETKNLGVKQGPFYVLVGATMPSILTEVGFISNSAEEARLKDPAFHDLVATSILEGVRGYILSLK